MNGRRESNRRNQKPLLDLILNNHSSVVICIRLSGVLQLRRFDSLRPFSMIVTVESKQLQKNTFIKRVSHRGCICGVSTQQ